MSFLNETMLCEIYLDYFNNFLTHEGYANYYNLPIELVKPLINHAKEIYNLKHS